MVNKVLCVDCCSEGVAGAGSSRQPLTVLSKLTSAMSLKQKLVDEIAEKQRHAKRLSQQYDEQLSYVEQAIRQMQARRDRELAKLGINQSIYQSIYSQQV